MVSLPLDYLGYHDMDLDTNTPKVFITVTVRDQKWSEITRFDRIDRTDTPIWTRSEDILGPPEMPPESIRIPVTWIG